MKISKVTIDYCKKNNIYTFFSLECPDGETYIYHDSLGWLERTLERIKNTMIEKYGDINVFYRKFDNIYKWQSDDKKYNDDANRYIKNKTSWCEKYGCN